MSDAQNAELHGVAIKTIRRWRRLYQRRGLPRGQAHCQVPCPICEEASLDHAAYAELLGWYLGDGHISRRRRQVFGLHVTNVSADIRELCCWALDLAQVPWRQSNHKTMSVSTRAGVARLDELIGPKS